MDPLHTHYERHLPHRLPPGATLFITYRLAGSLPRQLFEQLEEEARRLAFAPGTDPHLIKAQLRRDAFRRYDSWLDRDESAPMWLRLPAIAVVVKHSLHFYDPDCYLLHAYCLMPNHVHMVLTVSETLTKPFFQILGAQKRYSARLANQLLGQTGSFWQAESYDHVVRSPTELARVVAYVLENPVKAGLVRDWRDWPHTFLAE